MLAGLGSEATRKSDTTVDGVGRLVIPPHIERDPDQADAPNYLINLAIVEIVSKSCTA